MYSNNYEIEEYPFLATFYHLGIDDSKPLDQQKEEKVISFQVKCDVDDKNNGLNHDVITLYFPFDPRAEKLKNILGESVEVETYGLIQKGRVVGVRPSQLGGVKVICERN